MIDTSFVQQSYTNLQLSFRGAERQAPSVLSLALQFSAVMRVKATDGTHSSKMGTEDRLNLIIAEFHSHPGMISKFHLDEQKQKGCLTPFGGDDTRNQSRHANAPELAQVEGMRVLQRPAEVVTVAVVSFPQKCEKQFQEALDCDPRCPRSFH